MNSKKRNQRLLKVRNIPRHVLTAVWTTPPAVIRGEPASNDLIRALEATMGSGWQDRTILSRGIGVKIRLVDDVVRPWSELKWQFRHTMWALNYWRLQRLPATYTDYHTDLVALAEALGVGQPSEWERLLTMTREWLVITPPSMDILLGNDPARFVP